MKKPWLAAILSFLVAGLGQLYVGRLWRAALFFIMELATVELTPVSYALAFSLNILLSFISAFDAYYIAKKSGGIKAIQKAESNPLPEIRAY
ncbi:MAG: hypothetical protein ABIH11_01125 [Candidatus Altiarchaeota archaeon]